MRKIKFLILGILCMLLAGINSHPDNNIEMLIINKNDPGLRSEENLLFYSNKPFTGNIKDHLPDGSLKSVTPYYRGNKEGREIVYFPGGNVYSECDYAKNIINGEYIGYYKDGKQKFSYNYNNGVKDGESYDYFELGQPGIVRNYEKGIETGQQKEWRRNGRLFINYDIKDGRKYGLDNESAVCESIRKDTLWQ